MANKNRQNAENSRTTTSTETWRKPLQIPPRTNPMHAFYRGGEAAEAEKATPEKAFEQSVAPATMPFAENHKKSLSAPTVRAQKKAVQPSRAEKVVTASSSSSDKGAQDKKRATTTPVAADGEQKAAAQKDGARDAEQSRKLTGAEFAERLGFEIEDLFDVHELLRGKSFDIYRNLIDSSDEKGRCKITQPELMKRVGIKNRRTFYKHEEWLMRLNLLEKRHLPGDHKGVVYRVYEMSDALPIAPELLRQFEDRLKVRE